MFLGEYSHSLDRESRLALPARLREAAGEQLAAGLCLVCGSEPCIVAYTRDRLAHLLADLEADASVSKATARDFKRVLGGSAAIVVPDGQGRLLIPDFLRTHARIGKDVTVLGAVDAIEIWDAVTYRSREAARRAVFERLAPRVLG